MRDPPAIVQSIDSPSGSTTTAHRDCSKCMCDVVGDRGVEFTDPVIEEALTALRERGLWVGSGGTESELFRVELRRAARRAGVRLRTGILSDGRAWASTPGGLPGQEPWRGAAQHMLESGAEEHATAVVLDRLFRERQPEEDD